MSFSKLLASTKLVQKAEDTKNQFSIFAPILSGKITHVLTWNIGEVWRFEPLAKILEKLPLTIIVGYGSFTADDTYTRVREWQKRFPRMDFRLARNMHTKAWIGDSELWIGSANFVPNTITNIMVKAPKKLHKQLLLLRTEGELISGSTNPRLVTTKRKTPETLSNDLLLS